MKTETKEHDFKVGDLVVCNDAKNMELVVTESQIYTVIGMKGSDLITILSDRGMTEGIFHYRVSLYSKKLHPVGTIFSVLNEKEAEPYIGRKVECIDNDSYRDNDLWKKGILKGFRHNLSDYPFNTKDGDYFHLIRLIPESFEDPKPKVDPGLIEALKKSIQQWQIMCDNPEKSKEDVYKFLGGDDGHTCFLCDFIGYDGEQGNGGKGCKNCINWGSKESCFEDRKSPFVVWRDSSPEDRPANTITVLDHLKSELVRLESESK